MAMRDGDGTPDGDYSPRGDGDGGQTLPDSVHGDGDGEIFYFAGAGTVKRLPSLHNKTLSRWWLL